MGPYFYGETDHYADRQRLPTKVESDGPLKIFAPPRYPAGPESIYLADLYLPEGEFEFIYPNGRTSTEWFDESNEGAIIGEFDTRLETIREAVDRIRPVLEYRLEMALQRIADADIEAIGAVPASSMPSREHMKWLILFQVCRKPWTQIAAECAARRAANQPDNPDIDPGAGNHTHVRRTGRSDCPVDQPSFTKVPSRQTT